MVGPALIQRNALCTGIERAPSGRDHAVQIDNGGPAFLLFALVILYFALFTRYLGGTVWQRLLRVR